MGLVCLFTLECHFSALAVLKVLGHMRQQCSVGMAWPVQRIWEQVGNTGAQRAGIMIMGVRPNLF